MVYIILVLFIVILMYHYDYRNHKRGRKAWYCVLLLYFILLAGLRYRLGNDTVNYSTFFYDIYPNIYDYWTYDFSNEKFGRGYLFLNAIARTISDNFVVMQLLLAVFVNTVIFRFFYKNTKNIFTAVLLYFFFSYFGLNMEVLRESCAVAMFLLGWEFFWRHKWIKYYLCCIVAILFHPSSAFTLVLPLFTLRLFKKVFSINWLTLGITLGLFLMGMILTSKFFDIIRLIGVATLDNYADIYEGSSFAEGKGFNIVGATVYLFRWILYPIIFGWLIEKGKVVGETENKEYIRCQSIMLVCFMYLSVLSASMVILSRFNNYLIFFMIITFSDILFHKIRLFNKTFRLSYTLWVLAISPLIFLTVHGWNEPVGGSKTAFIVRVYPYSSVLNPELNKEREALYYYNFGNKQ